MLKKAVFKKSVNDGDVVKNALIGLAVAAVAAGASAVMNLKEGEDKDNE